MSWGTKVALNGSIKAIPVDAERPGLSSTHLKEGITPMIERLSARRGEEGFTLVELLVVIVILGVLASIVVFAVGGITNNSSKNACSTDKATVSAAEEAYYAQNSKYADMATLVSSNLLHSASTLVTITLTGTSPNYTAYSISPATAGAS